MKVLTFSRHFPTGHPKAGQPTYFIEQILNVTLPRGENGIINRDNINPAILPLINDFILLDGATRKHHTIRAGSRFKPGDMASLRVWSDKPYRSKQIEFAQVEVKKVWDVEIIQNEEDWVFKINGKQLGWGIPDFNIDQFIEELAKNDGLTTADFLNWFSMHPKKEQQTFTGQIICWSDQIEYGTPSPLTEKTIV
jgi:hypothetical protein